ncbi:MAG: DNA polymerase III subunit chi [Burkholderiaceae bacterium]
MTRVDFAFGAADKLRMACEVSQKHYLAGRRIVIFSRAPALLERLDRLLWAFQDTSFLPHAHMNDPLARHAGVVLAGTGDWENLSNNQLSGNTDTWLLNLDNDCPPHADRFPRVLEIVSNEETDRQRARDRWVIYKQAGYHVHAHDVSARPPS